MANSYRSARTAICARKPGRGSSCLAVSALAVAAAIASAPVLADSRSKEGKNKTANFGPVVPNITTGAGNFSRRPDFVVMATPVATSTLVGNRFTPSSGSGLGLSKVETGNSGPGPSALPVTAIANGSGVKSSGAAGNDAGVHLISRENGQRLHAAGQNVDIAEPGSPDPRGVVTAPGQQSLDFGKIIPASERSGIYAALSAQAGPPRANRAMLASDGRVLLTSSTRGHGPRRDHTHGYAYGRNRIQPSVSPDSAMEESDLKNVNAASVQGTASNAVNQGTAPDRDATLKTTDPAIGDTAKRDSNKSKSSVCS